MGSKICKPKMMDCLTCPKNNPKESFCFDKEECSVPFAMVRDGKIIAWEENKEDKKMRCTDCGLYECALRTPLGGCPNGEKVEHAQVITTPDTKPISVYELGRAGVGIVEAQYKTLAIAALALVDAVERYVAPKPGDKYCSRTEILNAKDTLKTLIKRETEMKKYQGKRPDGRLEYGYLLRKEMTPIGELAELGIYLPELGGEKRTLVWADSLVELDVISPPYD